MTNTYVQLEGEDINNTIVVYMKPLHVTSAKIQQSNEDEKYEKCINNSRRKYERKLKQQGEGGFDDESNAIVCDFDQLDFCSW